MTQVMLQQTQILQALLSNQQTGPAGRHSKLADFLRTRPLTFAAANEPLEAEDWLRDTEKKLRLARCSNEDKVDFATHQLKGAAAAWWENYLAARGNDSPVSEEEEEVAASGTAALEAAASATGEHPAPAAAEEIAEVQPDEAEPAWQPIPWDEFKTAFRTNFVPAGTMRLKKNEFRALKQGHLSVNEYLTKFNQLARYAPNDVADEEEKIDRFVEGMREDMRVQLILHDFPSFHHLVNKALVLENEKKTVEVSRKRKMPFQKSQGHFHQKSTFQGSSSFRSSAATPQKSSAPAQKPQGSGFRTLRPAGQPASVNPAAHLHCFACGEKGHFANQCPHRHNPAPKFNAGAAPIQGRTSAPSKSHQTSQASRSTPTQSRGHVNHVTTSGGTELVDPVSQDTGSKKI